MCNPFAAVSLTFVFLFSLIAETPREPVVAIDVGMPTTTPLPHSQHSVVPFVPISAVPTAPIHTSLGKFLFPYLFLHCLLASLSFLNHGFSYRTLRFSLSPFPTIPSQFEMGSSFATVPDPVSEATAFFARFDQHEVNDLDPADLWGFGPPYVDFHGFRVPKDCASYLVAGYSSHGDFMQGFRLGCSAKETS